jgi:hypothetical protein
MKDDQSTVTSVRSLASRSLFSGISVGNTQTLILQQASKKQGRQSEHFADEKSRRIPVGPSSYCKTRHGKELMSYWIRLEGNNQFLLPPLIFGPLVVIAGKTRKRRKTVTDVR